MILTQRHIGILGLLSVITLLTTLLVFGLLSPDFSFTEDFISKLGARGQANALWFNLFGFVTVGILLFLFGLLYGKLLNDTLLSVLLSLFGLGFAFTAIPVDLSVANAAESKAHTVAICLGLAFWLFGLSRLGYNQKLSNKIRHRANLTAVLLVASMLGFVFKIWSMPMTHRLVFMIVFGWTAISSIELINKKDA